MARKSKAKKFTYLEKWDTRYGQQERVVIRQQGRFVDSTNLTGLRKQRVQPLWGQGLDIPALTLYNGDI